MDHYIFTREIEEALQRLLYSVLHKAIPDFKAWFIHIDIDNKNGLTARISFKVLHRDFEQGYKIGIVKLDTYSSININEDQDDLDLVYSYLVNKIPAFQMHHLKEVLFMTALDFEYRMRKTISKLNED